MCPSLLSFFLQIVEKLLTFLFAYCIDWVRLYRMSAHPSSLLDTLLLFFVCSVFPKRLLAVVVSGLDSNMSMSSFS